MLDGVTECLHLIQRALFLLLDHRVGTWLKCYSANPNSRHCGAFRLQFGDHVVIAGIRDGILAVEWLVHLFELLVGIRQ